jgi:hypothetical protein
MTTTARVRGTVLAHAYRVLRSLALIDLLMRVGDCRAGRRGSTYQMTSAWDGRQTRQASRFGQPITIF